MFFCCQCVKALLFFDATAKTIDANAVNDMGDTPLHLAAKWGYGMSTSTSMSSFTCVFKANRKNGHRYSCVIL